MRIFRLEEPLTIKMTNTPQESMKNCSSNSCKFLSSKRPIKKVVSEGLWIVSRQAA